jgi:N utilization substance protein B
LFVPHSHPLHQARLVALQALCAYESIGDGFENDLPRFLRDPQTLADLNLPGPLEERSLNFAAALARGAWQNRADYDRLLTETAQHWSLGRMTPVDRNVLRLATHEMTAHPQTPIKVVINEAIELARFFGDTESAAFVNGVLDALARARTRPDAPSQPMPNPPRDAE